MQRLLIANRGEVASRIARSARACGIATVGLYSEPDAALPYLDDVDEAFALAGVTAAETYLNVAAVLAVAGAAGCDAVHPGYGFLAENSDFAAAVVSAGLTFVGPPAECVAAMGSKVRAKELARKAGVPVLPDAVVTDSLAPGDLAELATDVGYPLLVKASAGGGGRGIRLVSSADELTAAVDSARREAASSFGDDTVFLERFLAGPRHIEVQVFGDTHGQVIHLGDRECSVQRRHQKLLEECPAVMVDDSVRAEMATAAVRLCDEIGYVGAGTCEFLVQGDEYYFLEMNTRLQVEHTVTEQVTGLDLVALQLAVASGAPLPITQSDVGLTGHAIQARICAEDPYAGWLPSTGRVLRYRHAADDGIRYEDGIESGTQISPNYDSMITKVIATGADRDEAVSRLSKALRTMEIHGPATNTSTLVRILDADDFRSGAVSVNWLEARADLVVANEPLPAPAVAAAVIAAVAETEMTEAAGAGTLPAAWSNTPRTPVAWTVIDEHGSSHDVRYLPPSAPGRHFDAFAIDGTHFAVRAIATPSARPGSFRVEVDGRAEVLAVNSDGELSADAGARVWINGRAGQVGFAIAARFAEFAAGMYGDAVAGGPVSPMPGTVLAVHVEPGQQVGQGDPLVVVEAMKMEHVVRAAEDGVVERVCVEIGEAVDAGRALVEMKDSQ